MAVKNDALPPQLKALKTTDLTPLIRMAGVMMPRALESSLGCLNQKQRSAFDRVMPVGGEKRIYLHLVGTPTPPIVIGLAQPPKMSTMPEKEIRLHHLRGIRLTVDDLRLMAGGQTPGNLLKLGWRLKGQAFTILGILPVFWPFIRLGPAELRDMRNRMAARFKPLLDLLPRPKK